MKPSKIKEKLQSIVTQFDALQSKKSGYNPHALEIYFQRIEEVITDIESGKNPYQTVNNAFSDRLRDFVIRKFIWTDIK